MALAPDRPPLSPRHWPAWVGIGCLWLLAQSPMPLLRAIGRLVGALAHVFARRRRRYAERNVALAFPALDAAARARLVRANFRSLGIGFMEFLRAWWGPLGALPRHATIAGAEHVDAVLASGRGVLLVSGHFHTLELCGRLMCARLPLSGMYRRHESPVMEWAVKRGRLRYAAAMFARDELRPCLKHLKRGGILWYAPDQDMRGKDTVFAPFFGVPASTITATHQLARASGAAVIGFFHRRTKDGGYEMRVTEPLADFPSSDPVADTARINALIEAMVREAPEEYLWIHRRFKRRPEGAPKIYS